MGPNESKDIVTFGRSSKDGSPEEELERAGKEILVLIERAGEITANRLAIAADAAQKIVVQLRASEDRIGQLEAEVRHYQERAARAEEWLMRVYNEIQKKFFDENAVPQTHDVDR